MPRLNKTSDILIVDDSPAILALLRDMLKTKGYTNVRVATNVTDGLKHLDEKTPDVIFLDLMMPESSGLEFTKAALSRNPNIRIVLTTALPASSEAVMMAISQGASEYMQKPLRPDNLNHVLEHLWRGEDTQNLPYYG